MTKFISSRDKRFLSADIVTAAIVKKNLGIIPKNQKPLDFAG